MMTHKASRYLWEQWIRPLALPLLVFAAAKSSLADINPVPTGSMKPTVLEGDVVFVNKLAYDLKVPFTTFQLTRWADPARGDIVICFAPDDGTRLLKRIVGLPGDTIEVRHEQLFVNGAPLQCCRLEKSSAELRDLQPTERDAAVFAEEKLGEHTHSIMVLPNVRALRSFGPVSIPADSYFVMGDNRDNSKDSRSFGVVARREIVGEALGVFVSGDLTRLGKPRFNRFFSGLE